MHSMFQSLPVEVTANILGQLDSTNDLSNAIRATRSLWAAFWMRRPRIARAVILKAIGGEAIDVALAVVRFPWPLDARLLDQQLRDIVERHLNAFWSGLELSPVTDFSETARLYRLNSTVDDFVYDYASKANCCCNFRDYVHIPSWSHPSLHRCPLEPSKAQLGVKRFRSFTKSQRALLRKVFFLYELAAKSFYHRPEQSLFRPDQQNKLFVNLLHPLERKGLPMVRDYISRIYSILMYRLIAEWQSKLVRELPNDLFYKRDMPLRPALDSETIQEFIREQAPYLDYRHHRVYMNIFTSFGLEFTRYILSADWHTFVEFLRSNGKALDRLFTRGQFLGYDVYVYPDHEKPFNFWSSRSTLCLAHVPAMMRLCACEPYTSFVSFCEGKKTGRRINKILRISEAYKVRPVSQSHHALLAGFSWTRNATDLKNAYPGFTDDDLSGFAV